MSKAINSTSRWWPQTPEDRQMVLGELEAILASHHFSSSKRYPALLAYVVNKTLDGHLDQLKERTLGVEVFDRPPNYDTSADPVVRFSAGEVRKRIAQFYHESGHESRLQIDLPPGSYVPEFKLLVSPQEPKQDVAAELAVAEPGYREPNTHALVATDAPHPLFTVVPNGRQNRVALRNYIIWPVIFLLALAPLVAFALRRMHTTTAVDKLWKPFLSAPGPVQIVIGDGAHEVSSPPDPQHEILAGQLHGAYNRLSVCDVVAVSRLASVLGNKSRAYEIKEANFTSMQDLRNRPAILIGAYNNLWTMRLMEPLRFHFVKDGHAVRIIDSKGIQHGDWEVDYSTSNPSAVYDYAIVARYVDPASNSNFLIIAGIGAYGTEAASDAVATPHNLEGLLVGLPRGWENKNLEWVIKTAVINGEPGPAEAVAAVTW